MKTKTGDVEFDLTWDWRTPDADVVNDFEWTGKTVFRIPGPNEVDYGVESREIRSALNTLGLKSGGMKVCTWQDPVVLKSFSLRTTKQPFEFLRVGGHRRLGTLTKPKD